MIKESPKVFISYSRTREKLVLNLANKLIADGVDVILDIWDLKQGQSINEFLKSSIFSNDIDKVLIISDKSYMESADIGMNWVGYESTIINPQLYRETNQEKFIPIVTELDENNMPYLPNYLRYSLYMDMSDTEKYERNYKSLLRNIFGVSENLREVNTNVLNYYYPSKIEKDNLNKGPLSLHEKSNLKYGHNEFFTGYDSYLEKLAKTVKYGNSTFFIQAVIGAKGVGKTQLVVEYIYRNHKYYDLIWWLDANREESIRQGYTDLAEKLRTDSQDKEQELMNTLYFLESNRRKWLLVFDNADNIEFKQLKRFFPNASEYGHIILTLPTGKRMDELRCETVYIKPWTTEEVWNFIEKTTPSRIRTEQDNEKTAQLADILGHLPLALKQAVAYIEQEKMSIEDFIKILIGFNLDNEKRMSALSNSVLEKARNEDEISQTVAGLFSFCSTEGIPWRRLLDCFDPSRLVSDNLSDKNGSSKVATALAAGAAAALGSVILPGIGSIVGSVIGSIGGIILSGKATDTSKFEKQKLEHTILVLYKYGLIMVEGELVYMHRMVQDTIRENLKRENKDIVYIKFIIEMISEKFIVAERIGSKEDLEFNKNLYQHVLSILEYSMSRQLYSEDTVKLIYKLGLYLSHIGYYEEGIKYLMQGLETARKIGFKTAETSSLGSIGMLYRNRGEIEKAQQCFYEALKINEEIGSKQGEANQLGNIGLTYLDKGRLEDALESFRKALEINKKIANKPDEANNLGNIGLIYREKGELDRALQFLKQALNTYTEIGYKLDEANTLGNMGLIYHEKGNLEEAQQYLEKALYMNEQIGNKQGEANQLGKLGLVYQAMGKIDCSLQYIERALEIFEDIGYKQGEANQLGILGSVYRTLGDLDNALQYIEKALVIYRDIGNKQGVANQLRIIGLIYNDKGNYEQALNYYKQALEINRTIGYIQGEADDLQDIGMIYGQFGDNEQAIQHYKRALEIYMQIGDLLGSSRVTEKIGEFYRKGENFAQSLEYFSKAYSMFNEIRFFQDALKQLVSIGDIYREKGDLDLALEYYGRVLENNKTKENTQLFEAIQDNQSRIYLYMGDICLSKRDFDSAIEYYNKSIVLDETILESWLGLEKTYLELGQYESASEILQNLGRSKEKKLFDENVKSKIIVNKVVMNELNFFKHIEWDIQRQINVLLGRNGYGKTYMFRLLLCLIQRNSSEAMKFFANCGSNAYAKVYVDKDNEILFTHRTKTIFEKSFGIVPVLGIPNGRVIDKSVEYINYVSDTEETNLKLNGAYNFIYERKDENRIKKFLYELGVTYLNSKKTFEAEIFSLLEEVVFELTGNEFRFSEINVLDNGAAFQIFVNTENSNVPILFQKISEGTLSILVIFGLIYNYLKSISINHRDVVNRHGIVFIDEVDAHLHPEWQRKILPLLRRTFPHVQFFITAHSPLIVSGCLENEVSILRKKEKGDFSLFQFKQNFIGSSVAELYKTVFDVEEKDETYLFYNALYPFKKEIEDEITEIENKENPSAADVERLNRLYEDIQYISDVKEKQDEKEDIAELNNKLITLEIENRLLKRQLGK